VALLHLIPDVNTGKSVTIEALSSQTNDSILTLRQELDALCARRFVITLGDGSFQSKVSWAPLHRRIVAVELKLSRIEEVVAQARSHTVFATESYIGLPQDKAEQLVNSDRSEDIQRIGLGLLSVNTEKATVLIRAKSSVKPDPVLQMHCVERFWRDGVITSRRA
jgi:hypothetical protein